MFTITSGKIERPQKVVLYGPEGIGKSSFASQFPDPLFIDTEGSTARLDVKRFPRPTSYTMLNQEIDEVIKNPSICKTLVIDTVDWAEQLIIEHVLTSNQMKSIESFGYGKGYTYIKEELGRLLNKLSDVIEAGINVVLTAHAIMRKFEQPDELGAYDRYELKLGTKTQTASSALVKEWADMLLFANYETYSVATDSSGKKHKAQGGRRVMYTQHHPCWDAKNRHGLPGKMDFDYSQIAHIFISQQLGGVDVKVIDDPRPVATVMQEMSTKEENVPTPTPAPVQQDLKQASDAYVPEDLSDLPKALQDLMRQNQVTRLEIQKAISQRGYKPLDMNISAYGDDFIQGVLISAWDQVFKKIEENRAYNNFPFY